MLLPPQRQCFNVGGYTIATHPQLRKMTLQDFKIVRQLSDKYFMVQKDNKYGVIDNSGNLIIPFDIGDISMYTNDTFIIETGWRSRDQYGDEGKFEITYALYDTNNNKLTPHDDYSHIELFDEITGLALIERNRKIGFLNKNFQEIIPCEYSNTSNKVTGIDRRFEIRFSQDLCCLESKEGHSYFDKDGRIVLSLKDYSNALNFSEDFAAVENSRSGWGFINQEGTEVIECQYEDAYPFSNGLAAVQSKEGHNYYDRLWGFIDKENNLTIPFIFNEVKPFKNGFSIARKGDKYGVIDRKGNEVIPFIHSHIDGNETEPSWPYSYGRLDDTRFIIGQFNVYLTDTKIPSHN